MRPFLLMLTFLTRIPVPIKFDVKEEDFKKGIGWMPVIALLIGLLLYGAFRIMPRGMGSLFIAFILFVLYVIITGGLHIDGLADTLDAFGSNRDRERMLEIMRDSRIGTFGVLGIVLYSLGMVVLLQIYPSMVLYFPLIGRSAALLVCAINPYARAGGMGKTIVEDTKWKHFLLAVLLLISVLILDLIISGGGSGMIRILIPIALTYLLMAVWSRGLSKKLGGITGDIIGATVELSQIAFLVLLHFSIVILG